MPKGITFQDVIDRLERVEAQMRAMKGIPTQCVGVLHINHTNRRCIKQPEHTGLHETYYREELIQWGQSNG